jgi:hypothetical protein
MDLPDHLNVIKKGGRMKYLSLEDAKQVIGGGSVTGAIVSALKGYITGIFNIGQAVGGAIRRITTGNLCKF